jgi:hypothetical protein
MAISGTRATAFIAVGTATRRMRKSRCSRGSVSSGAT